MSIENKKLMRSIVLLCAAVLLIYRLPHDSYTISQYLIRPIKLNNSILFLNWILPFILFVLSIVSFCNLKTFKKMNKFLLVMAFLFILIPIMKWSLDVNRTNYHWLKNDALEAVDIKDSNLSLKLINNDLTMNFDLELIDYSRKHNEFNIRVYLPDSLREYFGMEYINLENKYRTYGHRRLVNVEEQIILPLSDDYSEQFYDFQWTLEDVTYVLYNDKEEVVILQHGF